MKAFFKFVFGLLVLVAVLAVAAHFTLRHLLNQPKFRAAVTEWAERATGRKIAYGRVDYRLWPPSLVVREMSVKEADGREDFASLAECAVEVDLRKRELTALRLVEPKVRVVQRADGSFNYSDLLPAKAKGGAGKAEGRAETAPAGPAEPAGEAAGTGGAAPAKKEKKAPQMAFSLREASVEGAAFTFVREREGGKADEFRVSDVSFEVRGLGADSFALDAGMKIGKRSSVKCGGTVEHAFAAEECRAALSGRVDIGDFADVRAFLPEGTLPFARLGVDFELGGGMAGVTGKVSAATGAATSKAPVSLKAALSFSASLPAAVAAHLAAGEPLPAELAVAAVPGTPPPGGIVLAADPLAALLLRHVQAEAALDVPEAAYGGNTVRDGRVTARVEEGGVHADGKFRVFDGEVSVRAQADLLGCPVRYTVPLLKVEGLDIGEALAANDLRAIDGFSGKIGADAWVAGYATAPAGFEQGLTGRGHFRAEELATVGNEGTLPDRLWAQLDNPLLFQVLPRVKERVEAAQARQGTLVTSRYENVTASFALNGGVARISDARAAVGEYAVRLGGTATSFAADPQVDFSADVLLSAKETDWLTGGKDRSNVLPYENGGLRIPLSIRGPMRKPLVLPDLDVLLQHALDGIVAEKAAEAVADLLPEEIAAQVPEALERELNVGAVMENLSERDRENVKKGLDILQSLGRSFR